VGRHRSDPRGLGRYLLLGAVAVVVLALVIVGVLALRGALSSKKPARTPQPTSAGSAPPRAVSQSAAVPTLLIRILHEPCRVFVKNPVTKVVLHVDNVNVQLGATLRYSESPLQVQISDPKCVVVYIHGRMQRPSATPPWILNVEKS